MARKKLPAAEPRLQSWADVDDALKQIGEIDRALALIEADQNDAIDAAKAKAKKQAKPWQADKAGLEADLKAYCEANRGEFANTKTKTLTFGAVGFRLSTKVLIKKVADTVQAIKDFGLTQCLRVKEEPDKEALKQLDGETLTQLGVILRTDNTFGYEINLAKLQEAP